jgi:hypothetical protein
VILVICVVGVFSTCEPNPTLLGIAERLAEDGTGVAVGVGEGAGDPAADFAPPPPQPIALTMEMSNTTNVPT